MSNQDLILVEVRAERDRQDRKWGEQNHHPVYWVAVITEEIGEAAKASIEFDDEQYRRELVQVAAVTIAALEALDRDEWPRTQSHGSAVDMPGPGQGEPTHE